MSDRQGSKIWDDDFKRAVVKNLRVRSPLLRKIYRVTRCLNGNERRVFDFSLLIFIFSYEILTTFTS